MSWWCALAPPPPPCSYEDEVYSEWVGGVDEVARTNLEKPLLLRNTDSLHISVNFDPKVRKQTLALWSDDPIVSPKS